jgi:hypothetical protein
MSEHDELMAAVHAAAAVRGYDWVAGILAGCLLVGHDVPTTITYLEVTA